LRLSAPIDIINITVFRATFVKKRTKCEKITAKKVYFLFINTACDVTVLDQSASTTYNYGSELWFS